MQIFVAESISQKKPSSNFTAATAAASADDKNKRQAAWANVQAAARRADTLGREREVM